MRYLRKVGKWLGVVVFVFGLVTFPLTVWSTVDFASKKGWLWRWVGEVARASPWIPAILVVGGAGFFGSMVLLDRRMRQAQPGHPVSAVREPETLRDRLHGGTGPLFPRPGDAAFGRLRSMVEQDAETESSSARWRTTYEFRRDRRYGPGVTLRVRSVGGEAFPDFRCRVTNPDGEVAEAAPRFRGFVPVPRSEAVIHYPGQFRGMVLMPPGDYVVEWYGLPSPRPASGRILLDQIAFTLHEGRRIP